MDNRKKNSNTGATGKKKGVFARLIEWIAQGAEKARKGGAQCSN